MRNFITIDYFSNMPNNVTKVEILKINLIE